MTEQKPRKRAYKRWRGDEILTVLSIGGPMTIGQLAEHITEVSPSTIRFHCRRLEGEGKIAASIETIEERIDRKSFSKAHPKSPRQLRFSLRA